MRVGMMRRKKRKKKRRRKKKMSQRTSSPSSRSVSPAIVYEEFHKRQDSGVVYQVQNLLLDASP